MAIDKYLNQLIADKQTLVDNLVEKGIEASNVETFTALVPKVSEIQGGGGKYAPRHVSFQYYTGADLDEEIANLDTSNITSMRSMFAQCENVEQLDTSGFDTSNVTDMSFMFNGCKKLSNINLNNFDTSNVTDMTSMFQNCYVLHNPDIKQLNVSKVTSIANIFNNCDALGDVNLDDMNFESCTNFGGVFNNASGIPNISMRNVNMSKVTNMSWFTINMLSNFYSLDMTGCDMGAVTNISYFCNSSSLTDFIFGMNLGKGYTQETNNYSNYTLTLTSCRGLTHDSLMSVINNLYDLNLTYDVANGGTLYTQQLVIGSTNMAKLTAEEIAIATNKGWTVS